MDIETTNSEEVRAEVLQRRTTRRWVALFAILTAIWIATFVNLIGWEGLTSNAWPIEGDQVSQNWWLETFKQRFWGVFTGGHLFGWTDDFGAGQPFGYFYFPLPAIVYSLISVAVGGAFAVKIIQAAGIVLVISGVWAVARAVQANKVAIAMSTSVVAFGIFYPHRYPVGADLSSIFIGEYSYAWGYGLAWWAIARIISAIQDETRGDQTKQTAKWRWVMVGGLVAAAVAGHANAAFIVGVAFIPYYIGLYYMSTHHQIKNHNSAEKPLGAIGGRGRGEVGSLWTKAIKNAIVMLAIAVSLLAFWLLPMWSMREEIQGNNKTADIPITFWFSDTLWRAILVVGIMGLVVGWVRKSPLSILTGVLGVGGLVSYEILIEWHALSIWAGRTMPLIYTGLLIGVGEFLAHLSGFGGEGWVRNSNRAEVPQTRGLKTLLMRLGKPLCGPKRESLKWRKWAGIAGASCLSIVGFAYSQERIEDGKDPMSMEGLAWKTRMRGTWQGVGGGDEDVRQLVNELVVELEGREGRILFATSRVGFDIFGAIDLNGEILRRGGGSGGASTFFHEGNRDRHSISFSTSGSMTRAAKTDTGQAVLGLDDFAVGVEAMRQLGIRYYITHETKLYDLASQEKRLEPIKTIGDRADGDGRFFAIYEIADHSITQPLNRTPGIVELFPLWGETTWDGKVREWVKRLGSAPYTGLHLARTGPEDADWDGYEKYGPATIRDVKVDDEKVSFTTDSIGTPVVVRMGYAAQWKVRGGEGPFHGAPHAMIVVPTSEKVELYYENPKTERVGLFISVLTLILILGKVLNVSWRPRWGVGRNLAIQKTRRSKDS